VLTGLLIALPQALCDSVLHVEQLQSRPYIDMTVEILRDFGVDIVHDNYQTFTISGSQRYRAREYYIEGDWSGAAFHLVAGAIAGDVVVSGVQQHSAQADRAILQALAQAGADIIKDNDTVRVSKSTLASIEFDATHCPDLFPPLVVLAAACTGTSKIMGVHRLKHKESDRAAVLQSEMRKLGVHIDIDNNTMCIQGGTIAGGTMHSHNDHRIAMAGAIAGLIAENPVRIEEYEAINKSYPAFFNDFESLQSIPL
jgi:3-phosphoshikimate 1-carboxyvinyltransferase